jgi:putative endonuclease
LVIFSRIIFEAVKRRARRGLHADADSRDVKGEIDLIGYDGETLMFVEVRTRTAREDRWALSEVSATAEKQHLVGRTARRFLIERHVKECPVRFDMVAIEEFSGQALVVRLHKNAFHPRR